MTREYTTFLGSLGEGRTDETRLSRGRHA